MTFPFISLASQTATLYLSAEAIGDVFYGELTIFKREIIIEFSYSPSVAYLKSNIRDRRKKALQQKTCIGHVLDTAEVSSSVKNHGHTCSIMLGQVPTSIGCQRRNPLRWARVGRYIGKHPFQTCELRKIPKEKVVLVLLCLRNEGQEEWFDN